MEQILIDTSAQLRSDCSVAQSIESFLQSSEVMRIFSSDCVSMRHFAGHKLLHGQQDSNPLVIQGHVGFNTQKLLGHLRDHWRLLTPVSVSGFRGELDDFLQVYRRQVSHGLLLIHDANQLPIETQAALIHLLHAQEQNGAVLQIALLADSDLGSRLHLFRPEGVAETRLSSHDPLFTQWVVTQAAQEQAIDGEPVPADIVNLAHHFSKGNPDDMRWIVNRWYAAANYAKRTDRESILDTAKVVDPVTIPLSQSRFTFWNSRQAMISGFLLGALVLGLTAYDKHKTNLSHSLTASAEKINYSLQALNTPDRMQALHWVAHHPELPSSHVVSGKNGTGQVNYHVEFGQYATKEEASAALKHLHNHSVHMHHLS